MSIKQHSTGTSPEDRLPNNPAEYLPTAHFYDCKKWRNIHGYIIRDVIENGTLERAMDGCHKFVKKVDGFEWWFVVDHHRNKENTLITAYVPEFDDKKELYDKHYKFD